MKKWLQTPEDAIEYLVTKATGDAKEIAALKILAKFINNKNDLYIEQNWLFAKMFLATFDHLLERYQDSQGALDEIRQILRPPLRDRYQNIQHTITHLSVVKNKSDISIPKNKEKLTEEIKKASMDSLDLKLVMNKYMNLLIFDEKLYD